MRANRGQGLVELALIFMVIIVILFGIIDGGRAFITTLTLENAAAEGAAYASMHPDDEDGAKARAINECAGSQVVDPGRVTSSIDSPPYIGGGQTITCTVSYNFDLLFGVLGDTSLNIRRSAVAPIIQ